MLAELLLEKKLGCSTSAILTMEEEEYDKKRPTLLIMTRSKLFNSFCFIYVNYLKLNFVKQFRIKRVNAT